MLHSEQNLRDLLHAGNEAYNKQKGSTLPLIIVAEIARSPHTRLSWSRKNYNVHNFVF